MRSGLSGKEAHAVVSVYQNIGQTVFYHKVKQFFGRLCVRPSVFVAMGDNQSARFGGFFESFGVVSVAATAILYAVYVVEIVNHFVKKGCNNVLDGARERSCADVDFVCAAKL